MKNKQYWQKRFEQLENASNKEAAFLVQDANESFRKAQMQIENQINSWYQRFAINNNISMAEARKILPTRDLAEFKWNVQEFIKYGEENAMNQQWMKQLENASSRYHVSKLEALKVLIQQVIEVLFGNQIDSIDGLMKNTFTNGYYRTIFEVQKGFNIGWDISSIDENKLKKIISKPWSVDGKNFSERIWGNKSKLINELHTELTQMVITGRSPDEAIKNIAKKMNTSKNNSGRLIMTESSYFTSASQKDAFIELDVEKFEIVATLDSSTSEICQQMDGEVFDMKDFEPGVTAPPFHVWCRTTTVPYFEDNYGERAARNANGKTYYVPSNIKFNEWQEKYAS
jgi:SPP1 gp7 family putative phage head morphogenesis protein